MSYKPGPECADCYELDCVSVEMQACGAYWSCPRCDATELIDDDDEEEE